MVQGIKWLIMCDDFGNNNNKPVPREYFFVRYLTEKIPVPGKQDFLSEFTLSEFRRRIQKRFSKQNLHQVLFGKQTKIIVMHLT